MSITTSQLGLAVESQQAVNKESLVLDGNKAKISDPNHFLNLQRNLRVTMITSEIPAGHDQSSPILENTSTLEITEERKRMRGDSHVVGQNVIVEKGLHNNVMDVDESRKTRENGKNYNPKDNTTED
ncbi:hypothetical protein L6452_08298 [Arctium lappa]|uniref:Uncharacterized protein n=1 Tax=Arctium lappa TaxID=4217 RepID=A0ACB9DHX1_ARCLA|nr:hypothetical protein L6452_08298 [Arctium lappa]